MRKWPKFGLAWPVACLLALLSAPLRKSSAAEAPSLRYDALSSALVQRAQTELERIRVLVDEGTLPKTRLAEAEAQLADVKDQDTLTRTLYGKVRLQDMTPEDARAMISAAERRVDRETQIVDDRRKLLNTGIIARSEFTAFEDELESRKRVLDLARNRVKLLDELRQMAATEQRFQRAADSERSDLKTAMLKFDGDGQFNLGDLPIISNEFEKHFHRPLPISALGQTLVHQSMGLDHRDRVDVALGPDQPEGVWLRHLLERLRVPYLAFRSPVAGAATAPHIHIGPESTRLKLTSR